MRLDLGGNWMFCSVSAVSPGGLIVACISSLIGSPNQMEEHDRAAQAKITIDTNNGTMDHPSSSGMEPAIGAPTSFSPVGSRYLIAR